LGQISTCSRPVSSSGPASVQIAQMSCGEVPPPFIEKDEPIAYIIGLYFCKNIFVYKLKIKYKFSNNKLKKNQKIKNTS
jgi:hypothetical protein